MRREICLVGLLLSVVCGSHVAADSRAQSHLTECKARSHMLSDFRTGSISVVSPDQSNRILLAKDFSLKVIKGGEEVGSLQIPDMDSNIRIVWAPDSRKFSVTYSDSGAEGVYHVRLYLLRNDGITEIPRPVDAAFEDFKKHYNCLVRGNNISLLGWTSDSNAVFLVAQVYPTSDCGSIWQEWAGYLVNLQGNILHRYGKKQTKTIEDSCEKSDRVFLSAPSVPDGP